MVRSRSTKSKGEPVEISFEGDCLKEHREVFDHAVKNYIEFVFSEIETDSKNFMNQNLFPSEYLSYELHGFSKHDLLQSGIGMIKNMEKKEKAQFMEDLKHEDMLSKFLVDVCHKCFD